MGSSSWGSKVARAICIPGVEHMERCLWLKFYGFFMKICGDADFIWGTGGRYKSFLLLGF